MNAGAGQVLQRTGVGASLASAAAGRRRARTVLVMLVATVAALAGAAALTAGTAAAAPGPAFDPATPRVFMALGAPTQLEQAVESNGQLVFQNIGAPFTPVYNAMAYDTVNNYLYGVIGGPIGPTTLRVAQIGADGVVSNTGVNTGIFANVATWNPNDDKIYFSRDTASSMVVFDPATNGLTTLPLSAVLGATDLTYANGFFWGVAYPTGQIVRVDPTTGTVTDFPVPASLFPGAGAGFVFAAAWTYGNGNIAFGDTESGNIYQISVADPGSASPTFTLVSQQPGPSNSGGDGASSPGLPTDLTLHKTATSPVSDGGAITYTMTVSDNGPGNSSGYVIKDTLPADLSNPTTTSTGCSITARVLTCVSANPLNAGTTSSPITVTATVPNPFVTPITNTATVIPNEQDPDPGNNSAGVTTNPSPQADLSIVKSASPSPIQPSENETYTLVAKNIGPDAATSANVSDVLPAALSFVSASTGCSASGQTVTCAAGTMAPAASKTFTVTVKPAASVSGSITNTATISSPTPDPNPGNNTGTTITPVAEADLSVTKTTTADTVVAGANETYQLVVKDNGPDTAENVTVSDSLPGGLTFVSASNGCTQAKGTVTCAAGTMTSGATQTFTVVAKVGSAVNHALTNTATAHSPTPDPNPGNNTGTTTVHTAGEADMSIVKTASVPSAKVGGQVIYTLVIHNAGPSDATGVKVSDLPGTGITLVSAKPSQGSCSKAGTCSLGTVVSGGSAQILVVAKVGAKANGSVVNKATVTADPHDPTPGNNTGTSTVHVPGPKQPVSDLQIVKSVNHAKAYPGQALAYTLTVTNHGPNTAKKVQVKDTASLGMKVLSATAAHGTCKVADRVITCSLETLANHHSVKITVMARVSQVGTAQNTASTTSNSKDPTPHNNIDGARTKLRPVLRLAKTASAKTVQAGHRITYQLKVTNPTSIAIRHVKVCDAMPLGLTFTGTTPKAKLANGRSAGRSRAWTPVRRGRSR